MAKFYKTPLTALTLAVSTIIMTACGGGGGGGSSPTTSVSGFAVDGPLSGATVTFLSTSAACVGKTTQTNSDGTFSFPEGCTQSAISITGGVDTTTGLTFAGILQAPESVPTAGGTSSVAVTPLTTLIAAAGGSANVAQQIATALGLPGTNLLRADPLANQALLAKTSATQELIEQISKALSSVAGNLTPQQLNTAVTSAIAAQLASGTSVSLSGASFINSVVERSVENALAQRSDLTAEQKDNISVNLAALVTPNIASNVAAVESAITNIQGFNSSDATSKITKLLAVKADIIASKADITSQSLVESLQTLLKENSDLTASQLASIGRAVETGGESATSTITTALDAIHTALPNVVLPNVADLVNAGTFTPDYTLIGGFKVGSTAYTPEQVAQSFVTPIVTSSIDNILINNTTAGIYANGEQNATATLSVVTPTKSILIHATELRSTFTARALTAAYLPAGSTVKVVTKTSTGTLTTADFTLSQNINVFSSGSLALNSVTLGQISPTLKEQFERFSNEKGTSIFTAVIQPTDSRTVATEYSSALTVANRYTLALSNQSYTGSGTTIKVTVQ